MSDIVSLNADAFVDQPAHHAEQRKVGLGDGFEEPVLLEKILVLGMPDERQMGVEDESEMSRACQSSKCSGVAELQTQARI